MPSYYPPGTRKGSRFYIVRGRIDGREYEVRTRATDKGGERSIGMNSNGESRNVLSLRERQQHSRKRFAFTKPHGI